jgi:hypothetical protein
MKVQTFQLFEKILAKFGYERDSFFFSQLFDVAKVAVHP